MLFWNPSSPFACSNFDNDCFDGVAARVQNIFKNCTASFLPGIFVMGQKSIVMLISIIMLIFLLFLIKCQKVSEGANCLGERPLPPPPCGRKPD